jgi:hypothetical protein
MHMIDRLYLIHSQYGPQVQPFRLAVSQHEVWQFLNKPDPLVLELFLIEYCALGVAMTEPVEGWIRRAGERCHQLGFPKAGEFLVSHADEQKDHHVPFINDTRWLIDRWNARHARPLDAEELLSQPLTAGVTNYRALHEAVISADTPYCQLAIEFEIERLTFTYGAAAIPKIVSALGSDAIKGLQFLQNSVSQGVWHASQTENQLNQILHDVPAALAVLTETAGMALTAYGKYLSDCLAFASKKAALLTGTDISSAL